MRVIMSRTNECRAMLARRSSVMAMVIAEPIARSSLPHAQELFIKRFGRIFQASGNGW